MRDVFVAGVGMTKFGKFLEVGIKRLADEAVSGALEDAGAEVGQLEAVYGGNAVAGLITGQEMIRMQVALRPLGVEGIPVFNVENACASSASAFHLAWQSVAYGIHDVVLAVGVEKMTHPDKQVSFDAVGTAVDLELQAEMAAALGAEPNASKSFFMDIYAGMTKNYMERSGATQADMAAVVVKAHRHAKGNPRAQYRNEVSLEQVLESREISWPLTLLMCSPIGDGGAATVLASQDGLERLVDRAGRPRVKVLASVIRSGSGIASGRPKSAVATAQAAYEVAGLGPDDLDCAEIHDATAPAELFIYEDLGLAAAGAAAGLLASGATTLGGRLPVNTSGGLLCKGHPIGATGIAQIAEVTWQLRGEAAGRQVEGARIALTQNGGGWLDEDSAAMAVHLFGKA